MYTVLSSSVERLCTCPADHKYKAISPSCVAQPQQLTDASRMHLGKTATDQYPDAILTTELRFEREADCNLAYAYSRSSFIKITRAG